MMIYEMDYIDQDQVILRGFGNALTRAGLAPSSRAKYLQHARHFIVWLGSRHPAHIGRAEAEEYLDTLGGENFSVATFRVRIAALRKLYRYLEDRGHLIDESGRDVRTRSSGSSFLAAGNAPTTGCVRTKTGRY